MSVAEFFPISPTRCRALHCGHYFQQRYLTEKKSDETEGGTRSLALLIGSHEHKVLEIYTKSLLEAKQSGDSEVFDLCFKAVWNEQDLLPEPLYEQVRTGLLSFVENNPIDPDTLWRAEEKMSLDWDLKVVPWESEEVFIRGILDKVDVVGGVKAVITDYKHFLPSESKLRHSYQTKIYPFLLACLPEAHYLETFDVVYHSIQTNRKVRFSCTKTEALSYESQLRHLSKRVARKVANPDYVWKAFPGENCPYCSFVCPLMEHGVPIIRNLEDATTQATQLYAYEREVSRLRQTLGSYLGSTGEKTDIGAGVYIVNESTFFKGLRADRVIEICKEEGLEINKLLKINTDALKKIGSKLKKRITEGGVETTVKRLKFEKKNVEGEGGEES